MFARTDDVRIDSLRPLLPPAILMEEIPLDAEQSNAVARIRSEVGAIVEQRDDRLLVVVGPCSIHDPVAALEYAARLQAVAARLDNELCIVMRTYFEKPRTTIGWKGLINDPGVDGSFQINSGLRIARRFLRDVISLGLGTATEFLDPITPQFVADLVCWGAIGARTTESQVHRELASGLSMPVGFKNGTGGSVQVALDAIRSAASPHRFLSVTKQGVAAIVTTRGNSQCHLILRGGHDGPNYSEASVTAAAKSLEKAGLCPAVMIDASHANSGKDFKKQPLVNEETARQVAGGSRAVLGVMLESFLVEGRQDVGADQPLTYGQSITDGCLSWEGTEPVLQRLAEAVAQRRRSPTVKSALGS
jgi:3-deoxy-7-phosphoheptulonate synthase